SSGPTTLPIQGSQKRGRWDSLSAATSSQEPPRSRSRASSPARAPRDLNTLATRTLDDFHAQVHAIRSARTIETRGATYEAHSFLN
ncbi:uncharacterized protein BJX67DRAFT_368714, partial [Aspergillus lucknowensis]